MTRQIGAAQRRALMALADTENGVGQIPFLSAPGLMNKGLVIRLGRANPKPNAAYVCQLTDAGRALARRLCAAEAAESARRESARHATFDRPA